jgi:hypothetical protein
MRKNPPWRKVKGGEAKTLSEGGRGGRSEFVGAGTETPWNLTFETSMNPDFFCEYINPENAEDDDSSRSPDWLEEDSLASID